MRNLVNDSGQKRHETELNGRLKSANNRCAVCAIVDEIGDQIERAERVRIRYEFGEFLDGEKDEKRTDRLETAAYHLLLRGVLHRFGQQMQKHFG